MLLFSAGGCFSKSLFWLSQPRRSALGFRPGSGVLTPQELDLSSSFPTFDDFSSQDRSVLLRLARTPVSARLPVLSPGCLIRPPIHLYGPCFQAPQSPKPEGSQHTCLPQSRPFQAFPGALATTSSKQKAPFCGGLTEARPVVPANSLGRTGWLAPEPRWNAAGHFTPGHPSTCKATPTSADSSAL